MASGKRVARSRRSTFGASRHSISHARRFNLGLPAEGARVINSPPFASRLMSAETIHAAAVKAETRPRPEAARREWWLFGPRADVCVFGGSALASLLLLWVGARAGVLEGDSPEWAWVPAVLLVDVAHVYASMFRVYFDVEELKSRAALYMLAPAIALALGVALYSEGEALFWRALAYLAVFHFVRQQYGWVALYRARAGEQGRAGWFVGRSGVSLGTA